MLEYIIASITIFGMLYFIFKVDEDYDKYKPKQTVEDIPQEEIVEMVLEEVIVPPEPIYMLNTHKIKYKVFDPDLLSNYGSRRLYKEIVLDNEWLNEPFCSTVFKILMIVDKDEFMIHDQNSRVVIANLRGKHNKMLQTKSYKVFSTLEIIKSFFHYAFSNINRYKQNDAQDIVITCLLMIISESKHFETHQSIDVYEMYLKGYNRQDQVKNILKLIKSHDTQFEFIHKALIDSFKIIQAKPYVEKQDVILKLPLLPKLPQKVLLHI